MRHSSWALVSILGLPLIGCGTISSWFPDKQKQYKYSTEIPSLEIPPDLLSTSSSVEGARAGKEEEASGGETRASRSEVANSEVSENAPGESLESRGERNEIPPEHHSNSGDKNDGVSATLGQSSDEVPMIEIEEPFDRAWNDVAKALGRLELEISDRNRSEGMYFVYYGGEGNPGEPPGFFGKLASVFSGMQADAAREYRVKLEENGEATTVYVQDKHGKPQTEGPGFELLRRLHQTLSSLTEPAQHE